MKRAYTYVMAVRKWRRAGKPKRNDDEVSRIYETCCKPCKLFNQRGGCGKCGCRVNKSSRVLFNKLRMATEGCPATPPKFEPNLTARQQRRLERRSQKGRTASPRRKQHVRDVHSK